MSKKIFYLDFGQDCVFSILNITEGGTTGGTTWWWWYPHLPTPWIEEWKYEAVWRGSSGSRQGSATIWWWYHELVPIVVPIQNSIFGVFMQNKKKSGCLLIQRQTNPFLTGQFVENVEKNYFQRVKSRCWRFSKFQTRNFINFGKSDMFSLFHS